MNETPTHMKRDKVDDLMVDQNLSVVIKTKTGKVLLYADIAKMVDGWDFYDFDCLSVLQEFKNTIELALNDFVQRNP